MSSSVHSFSRSRSRCSSYGLGLVTCISPSLLEPGGAGLAVDLHCGAVEAAAGGLEARVGNLDHLDARGADLLDRALRLRGHDHLAGLEDLQVADVVGD